jgi:transposase
MVQSEAAWPFDVSLSSVERYIRKFRQGRPLSPGKLWQTTQDRRAGQWKLLEEYLIRE